MRHLKKIIIRKNILHIFNLNFITGVSVGIEIFTGDATLPGDKFAVTIDLFIIRFTYVYSSEDGE